MSMYIICVTLHCIYTHTHTLHTEPLSYIALHGVAMHYMHGNALDCNTLHDIVLVRSVHKLFPTHEATHAG